MVWLGKHTVFLVKSQICKIQTREEMGRTNKQSTDDAEEEMAYITREEFEHRKSFNISWAILPGADGVGQLISEY